MYNKLLDENDTTNQIRPNEYFRNRFFYLVLNRAVVIDTASCVFVVDLTCTPNLFAPCDIRQFMKNSC